MPFTPLFRRPGPFRALRLRVERARLAARIGELRDLLDVPHDLADVARARIVRLDRRICALDRLVGAPREKDESAGFCCQVPANPALTG